MESALLFLDNTWLVCLGSALLLTGYGLLAYEQCATAQNPTIDMAAHASLSIFFCLSYLISLTIRIEYYDAFAALGHLLFLVSHEVDNDTHSIRLKVASEICLCIYYTLSALRAASTGSGGFTKYASGVVAMMQFLARAALAVYYVKQVSHSISYVR